LFGVEQLQFDDGAVSLQTTGSGEFQVNTYTSSDQYSPSTTALADGGFVVTLDSYNQDYNYDGIFAQIYNSDGTVQGNEFQVNTYTTANQMYPSVTALNNGDLDVILAR